MGLYEVGVILIILFGCVLSYSRGYNTGYDEARWEYVKEKLHRLELLASISLIIVLVGVLSINNFDLSKTQGLSLPSITGYVTTDTITKNTDIQITQSQIYDLSTEGNFTLNSLRIGGVVEGKGLAQIYLEDSEGHSMLVYSNMVERKEVDNLITGYAAANEIKVSPGKVVSAPNVYISENKEFLEGVFYTECVETCFINLPFTPDNFRVPGTIPANRTTAPEPR